MGGGGESLHMSWLGGYTLCSLCCSLLVEGTYLPSSRVHTVGKLVDVHDQLFKRILGHFAKALGAIGSILHKVSMPQNMLNESVSVL